MEVCSCGAERTATRTGLWSAWKKPEPAPDPNPDPEWFTTATKEQVITVLRIVTEERDALLAQIERMTRAATVAIVTRDVAIFERDALRVEVARRRAGK